MSVHVRLMYCFPPGVGTETVSDTNYSLDSLLHYGTGHGSTLKSQTLK